MKTCIPILLSFVFSPLLLAQEEAPKPAKELARLEAMIGSWEGSGTTVPAPGQPKVEWKSKSSVRWVLGGHFLREDLQFDFGEAMGGTLHFISFIGWDRERKQYRSAQVDSMGSSALVDVHVLPSGALVSTYMGVENGLPTVNRFVGRYEGDDSSLVAHRAVGDGEFFLNIEGKAKRISKEPAELEILATAFAPLEGDPMQRFKAMAGSYLVEGSMGGMQITGIDECRMIFGDTVFMVQTEGQPGDYQGIGFITWDPVRENYRSVAVSSMAEMHSGEGLWVGDKLVMTHNTFQEGQPMLARDVLQVDKDGKLLHTVVDSISSVNEPARIFEASYKKR